jgi:hypothetical protein
MIKKDFTGWSPFFRRQNNVLQKYYRFLLIEKNHIYIKIISEEKIKQRRKLIETKQKTKERI